jgi:RND family efflux transporter MFP subunit
MKRDYNWKMIGITGGGALVFLVVVILLINGSKDIVTAEAKVDTLVRTVDVTGRVVPTDEVDLGFSASGRISSINVREGQIVSRGQVIATLDSSEVEASIRQAIAERNVSEKELNSITGEDSSNGRLQTAKRDAYNTINKSLNSSITQVKTNIDTLFSDPQSGRPKLNFSIRDYFFQQSIVQQRVSINTMLDNWSKEVANLNTTNITRNDLEKANKNLREISNFLTDLSKALSDVQNDFTTNESAVSQYRSVVTSSRSIIDGLINEISVAQENLRNIDSQIPIQEARVIAASASIDRFQAQRNNLTIIAPFDGVVVSVDAVAGEIISANKPIVTLMNNSSVEVEVFVPEIYMRDLSVGDPARIRFDALGSDVMLGAIVSYMESRGVERNGIVTYKTKLAMTVDSPDVKTGMTALIEIDTLVVEEVLMIPRSATKFSEKTVTDVNRISAKVKVLDSSGKIQEREVVIGRSDSKGLVEVVSGIDAGEKVVVSLVK